MAKIKKAIITAAGYGTRFLPATKNVPKELLPIINRPTIDYIVSDFVKAGIEDIIIVTRFGNHAIEDYFDSAPALEKYLADKGKEAELEEIKKIYSSANFIFVRQDANLPYGNASPLYSARSLIGKDEAFFYAWGDDIVLNSSSTSKEMMELFNKHNPDIVLNCVEVEDALIPKLGIVELKNDGLSVSKIIEKPSLKEAPSNIASVFAFLFKSDFLNLLDPASVEAGKEFMIQNAIDKYCKSGKVIASKTKGKWLTTGDPLNYLKATVEIALSRNDLKDDFLKYLKSRIN